jgi:prolyl oligopeptidase
MCTVAPPPLSRVESVVDVLHGVPVTDPYRWLEDENSRQTRAWIKEQTQYARAYLDAIPGRERIRERVRELVDVETYDSFFKSGTRYFFRKRLPGQEQPSIHFRESADSDDQLLVDPAARGTGNHTAVKPIRISPDGSMLLYEVKQGGERMGTFEILDVATRKTLSDSLPHGYLRGFAFAPDAKSFYYVHEATNAKRPFYRAALHHVLGTSSSEDKEVFCAGEDKSLRLAIAFGKRQLAFLVFQFLDKTRTDFYLWRLGGSGPAIPVFRGGEYSFAPRFVGARILAMVDENAPNRRIVELETGNNDSTLFLNVIPETDALIRNWAVTANHILVSYVRGTHSQIAIFDLFGKRLGEIPCHKDDTVRIVASSPDDDEVLLERDSFTRPIEVVRCCIPSCAIATWSRRLVPFRCSNYSHVQVRFPSKDSTDIPMFLVGRSDLLSTGPHPTTMTSYGGYGIPMTPRFSVLVAFLMEHGCLFALPNIRGGSEFGAEWHRAGKRRNRQVAIDDFLSAAESLVHTLRTTPGQLAIFGGSNSGLLVGAAITQRPHLFCAALCMVPLLDMLRFHLFDNAGLWKDEFGTAEDPQDFEALASYSPYHAVRDRTAYPATMFVSGDADQNCNPLHARKMAARLQAANSSASPIFLDYCELRGHSPVLPLSQRIDALVDRLAFLCDRLGVAV